MRAFVFAAVALSLAACPHRSVRPPPQLAPAETLPLNVTFIGYPANPYDLYVCGWLDPKTDAFSCVDFATFMREYQTQP